MDDRYVELLMDRVREDRFPSGDHMDRIEVVLSSREQAIEYLDVLYEKLGESRYPSGELLDRAQRTASRVR